MTESDPLRRARSGKQPRHTCINFGMWNIRTLHATVSVRRGEVEIEGGAHTVMELCTRMREQSIALCAISEHRWRGSGSARVGDRLIVFSGIPEDSPQALCGVGVALG